MIAYIENNLASIPVGEWRLHVFLCIVFLWLGVIGAGAMAKKNGRR